MGCGRARRLMPVAVDGQLAPTEIATLDQHLASCAACEREMTQTRRLVAALGNLSLEQEVPARLEQATMRQIRHLAAEAPEPAWRSWFAWPTPLLAAAAMAAVVVVRLLTTAPVVREERVAVRPRPAPGRATATASPVGGGGTKVASRRPTQPLPALEQAPDAFAELELLRNLEKLRHFDAIRTTTLDDELNPPATMRQGDG